MKLHIKLQLIFGGVSRLIVAKTSRWGLPAKGRNRAVEKLLILIYYYY